MKVTDVVLTKRSRAGSAVIKQIKTNPFTLQAVCKMTPNQFKENLLVDVRYKNGNDQIEAKSLKYNVSDLGRSILNENFTNPEGLRIPNPEQKDSPVSGDYLIEVRDSLFSMDDGTDEIPLTTSKKQDNILDDLEAILQHEAKITENEKFIVKETKGSLFITEKEPTKLKIDESKEAKREIKYRKISLFDEE